MRSLLPKFICCLLLPATALSSFSRTIVSESDKKPIIYASVGVINCKLGTVTDTLGNFSLKIPAEYINDSIRISSVGYLPRTFAVRDIANLPDTITLAEDAIRLGENRAWLKEIGFTIITDPTPLSRMKFRVNIYRKEDSSYVLQNIGPLYFDYNKSQLTDGSFSYVFPEEIMLDEGDFYVELEFLENFANEYFIMKTKPLTGKTRYRYASQSDWETLPFGAPIWGQRIFPVGKWLLHA